MIVRTIWEKPELDVIVPTRVDYRSLVRELEWGRFVLINFGLRLENSFAQQNVTTYHQ